MALGLEKALPAGRGTLRGSHPPGQNILRTVLHLGLLLPILPVPSVPECQPASSLGLSLPAPTPSCQPAPEASMALMCLILSWPPRPAAYQGSTSYSGSAKWIPSRSPCCHSWACPLFHCHPAARGLSPTLHFASSRGQPCTFPVTRLGTSGVTLVSLCLVLRVLPAGWTCSAQVR